MEDEKIYRAINQGPDKNSLRESFGGNVSICVQNINDIIVTEDETIPAELYNQCPVKITFSGDVWKLLFKRFTLA